MQYVNLFTGQPVQPADWQLRLQPGDYYIIERPQIGLVGQPAVNGPTVYGQIIKKSRLTGLVWVKGFSDWCPEGETGLMNICEPTRRLTTAEFEAARDAGWPQQETNQ